MCSLTDMLLGPFEYMGLCANLRARESMNMHVCAVTRATSAPGDCNATKVYKPRSCCSLRLSGQTLHEWVVLLSLLACVVPSLVQRRQCPLVCALFEDV